MRHRALRAPDEKSSQDRGNVPRCAHMRLASIHQSFPRRVRRTYPRRPDNVRAACAEGWSWRYPVLDDRKFVQSATSMRSKVEISRNLFSYPQRKSSWRTIFLLGSCVSGLGPSRDFSSHGSAYDFCSFCPVFGSFDQSSAKSSASQLAGVGISLPGA